MKRSLFTHCIIQIHSLTELNIYKYTMAVFQITDLHILPHEFFDQDFRIIDLEGLTPEFFKQVVPLLNNLNLFVNLAPSHPDHHSRVCERLSLYLTSSFRYEYPITKCLIENANTDEEKRAVILTMATQKGSNVQICYNTLFAIKENRRKRKVLKGLRDIYWRQAYSTIYLTTPEHIKKFQAYQVEQETTTRDFFAIW